MTHQPSLLLLWHDRSHRPRSILPLIYSHLLHPSLFRQCPSACLRLQTLLVANCSLPARFLQSPVVKTSLRKRAQPWYLKSEKWREPEWAGKIKRASWISIGVNASNTCYWMMDLTKLHDLQQVRTAQIDRCMGSVQFEQCKLDGDVTKILLE